MNYSHIVIGLGYNIYRIAANLLISVNRNRTKVESAYSAWPSGHLLKFSIFAVDKAATPKNGVEFCQKCIGAIRFSLARLCGNIGLDFVESTFLLFCYPSNLSLSKTRKVSIMAIITTAA